MLNRPRVSHGFQHFLFGLKPLQIPHNIVPSESQRYRILNEITSFKAV